MRKNTLLLLVSLLSFGTSLFAQALSFANPGYVNITNNTSLRLQNFTLEAWIRIEGSGTATGTLAGGERGGGFKNATVVPIIAKGRREKGSASTAVNYFLGYRLSDMKLVGDFEDNASGAHHPVVGNAVLATNVWTHVAITYATTGTWRLYVNGQLDKTLSIGTYTPQSLSNVTAAIGSALNSSGTAEGNFKGRIDEVRIWNAVRSGTEILNSYQLQLTSGTGLVARYGFNEGSGTTAANTISSASNGTLVNNVQWANGFQQGPPTVRITSPATNATFTEPASIAVTADASDADGTISKIEFFNGSLPIGTVTAAPYTVTWSNVAAGTYSLTAKATDNTGVTTTSAAVTVNVQSSTVNHPPDAPASPSPSDGASVSGTSAMLCVKANDIDNTQVRVRFYGRKKVSGKKFSIIWLPDTQNYTAELLGGTNKMFKSQTSWIVNNLIARNIVYVGQLGDCSEHGDTYEVEWKRADTAIKILENPATTGLPVGIPYGVSVGNHDQTPRDDVNGTTIFYNQYFGSSRFSGRSYYGGHMGTKNNNHYQLFDASGIPFLIISLEWNSTTSFAAAGGALDWAEGLVKANPTRKVIVMTHFVINGSASFSAQGSAIYNRLKIYPNVLLLVGGHWITSTDNGEARRSDTYNNHTIHSTLQDYQLRTNGGNGMLRIYEFDPLANTVAVQTYSPYTNIFETDASSQFTLNVDLATSPQAYALIGEVNNVTSGTNVCVNWSSLQQNTDYEWYAEVYDGQYTTKGPTWSFLTGSRATAATRLARDIDLETADTSSSSNLFDVYPNPNTGDRLTISLKRALRGKVRIEIVNASGQVQLRKEIINPGATIDLDSRLLPGVYSVVVKTGVNGEATKLLLVR